MATSLRLTSSVEMESPKGQLGGWFKTLSFDKNLLILNGNFNKNDFSVFVIQYVTSFHRLLLKCWMVVQKHKPKASENECQLDNAENPSSAQSSPKKKLDQRHRKCII